jgi:hypothetical protein
MMVTITETTLALVASTSHFDGWTDCSLTLIPETDWCRLTLSSLYNIVPATMGTLAFLLLVTM